MPPEISNDDQSAFRDENPERGREQRAGDSTGAERDPVVAGVDGGREAGDRGDQHDPFGTEVDDAGALVDEQAERGEGEHGARVQGGSEKKRELIHQVPSRAGSVVDATTGLSGASSIVGALDVATGATCAGFQRRR